MSTPHHQRLPGASGSDAALPRPPKLVYPGMDLERVAQGTAPAPVMDVRLVWKDFA